MLTLAGGETATLTLRDQDPVSTQFALYTLVRDSGGVPQYTRYLRWGAPRTRRWETTPEVRQPIEIAFAHYPYLQRLRLRADIGGLPREARLDGIAFTLRATEGAVVTTTRLAVAAFNDGPAAELTLDLPPLAGTYEIVAVAEGHGVPDDPIIIPFTRTVYPWEHAGLGTSRTVYPPFTPLRAAGLTLHSVLKEYDLNGAALLDQVRTLDQQGIAWQPLLAAPMRFTARIDGEAIIGQPGAAAIREVADDRIIAAGSCTLGPLAMTSTSTLDYDGLLKVELTLAPTNARVEELALEIPLHGAIAQMMHAMTDGLRYPIFTGVVPAGEGRIWDASRLVTSEWPANFCTYIFLGDAARGLCWLTENDAGWSWDPAQPNLELRRDGDTVTLRIRFISAPCVLDAPRTYVFGLQAAPVKPRLEGWRHRWHTDRYSILGCDRHWFRTGQLRIILSPPIKT